MGEHPKQHLVTYEKSSAVCGLVALKGHLVVVHYNNDIIYVYHESGDLRYKHPVRDLINPRHMVNWNSDGVVISDWQKQRLTWVHMCADRGIVTMETMATKRLRYKPVGLYVGIKPTGNMIVCAPEENSLYIYTTVTQDVHPSPGVKHIHEKDIMLKGKIQLPPDVKPYHVTLHQAGFIVTDYDDRQMVWINEDGSLMHHIVSPSSLLRQPRGLAADNEGNILVTDHDEHRVLMFDRQGGYTGQLLSKQDGIYLPNRLWLDQISDTLYVTSAEPVRVMSYTYSTLLSNKKPAPQWTIMPI